MMVIADSKSKTTPSAKQALVRLTEILITSGYADYASCFSPVSLSFTQWKARSEELDPPLRRIVNLFMLGEPSDLRELPVELVHLVPELQMLGVLDCHENSVYTPGLSLLPVLGRWIFSQQTRSRPTIYFGDDSVALMLRLVPPPGGRALDLCAGPGAQALHTAGFVKQVTTVEINPVVYGLQRLNVAMNRLDDRILCLMGSLYQPVEGQRFDFITANPPLLPCPSDLDYPFVGDGGGDGLDFVRKILEGLPLHLSTAGRAQIICSGLSDGILPLSVGEFRSLAKNYSLDLVLTVAGQYPLLPGSPFVESIALSACRFDTELPDLLVRTSEHFIKQGASHLAFFFLHASLGSGRLTIVDLASSSRSNAMWYVTDC